MLQVLAVPATTVPPWSAELDGLDSADPLLTLAGPIAGTRALILSDNSADLMCRLLRSGCVAATALRMTQRPTTNEHYNLVLVPQIACMAQIDPTISHARCALTAAGRLVLRVTADPAGRIARALTRSLRLNGFLVVRTRTQLGMAILRADLRSLA